jgi:hypothetical protein
MEIMFVLWKGIGLATVQCTVGIRVLTIPSTHCPLGSGWPKWYGDGCVDGRLMGNTAVWYRT